MEGNAVYWVILRSLPTNTGEHPFITHHIRTGPSVEDGNMYAKAKSRALCQRHC